MASKKVFILTHGRAKEQKTLEALRRQGYTGDVCLVADSGDDQLAEYKKRYGEMCTVFDKKTVKCDTCINEPYWHAVLFPRNEAEKIAKKENLSVFAMFDDDITTFVERYYKDGKLKRRVVSDLDEAFDAIWEIAKVPSVSMVGIGSQNMYIGGKLDFHRRYGFGCFFRDEAKEVQWKSVMNEDYVTQLEMNRTGRLCVVVPHMAFEAKETGKGTQSGGMKETYSGMSPYTRSFFAVMEEPAATKVDGENRIVHSRGGEPKIVSGKWKK